MWSSDLSFAAAVTAIVAIGGTAIVRALLNRRQLVNDRVRLGTVVPEHVKQCLMDHPGTCPVGVVDGDAFDANVAAMIQVAAASNQMVRVATKSVRCVALLVQMLDAVPAGKACGLMTFTARETLFLARDPRIIRALKRHVAEGAPAHSNLLLAYPVADGGSVELAVDAEAELSRHGLGVALMVDDAVQVGIIARGLRREGPPMSVWVDVDMSLRPFVGVHLGVRRSPLRERESLVRLLDTIHAVAGPAIAVAGVMGYEAQVAGLADFEERGLLSLPESIARSCVKRLSERDGHVRRSWALQVVRSHPCAIRGKVLCNGGGSGSLISTGRDAAVSEVTIGSGALCGHLFDRYLPAEAPSYQPALFFALRVTRRPDRNIFTCHGGGWCASGEAGASRLPKLVWPSGSLVGMEGAGEVQTPITVRTSGSLEDGFGVGSVAVFRPCKSGELGDTLCKYVVVKASGASVELRTYRGDHVCAWSTP
jgi:D-serine deaminase-like pyridoxal phosphate-dependent protein